MKTALFSLSFFLAHSALCQNSYTALVKDAASHEALVGANVYFESLGVGGVTDANGRVEITQIPDGTFTLTISYIGYRALTLELTFPSRQAAEIRTVYLEPTPVESDQVVVTSTRTNGVIDDVPVRVEVLGNEEVREETAIKPGNISKLLGETTGIQVQQTSATSGNVAFRIQGLQGKYTQLLKDGFPLYGGFSSGLSLLQIPPLDLLQVEVIKGSASSLYGGDAIAGIVNLVTREPSSTPEWTAILNQTQKHGRDISSFYSSRSNRTGVTFLASQSTQGAVDVNGDGFTDLPEFQQTTVNPKFYYYFDENTTLSMGVSSSFENRTGGDAYAIRNAPDSVHTFIENSKSDRLTSQLKLEKHFPSGNRFTLRNSINEFRRNLSVLASHFNGEQTSTYTDLSYLQKRNHHALVLGLDVHSDAFHESGRPSAPDRPFDHTYSTIGLYAQDDRDLSEHAILQAGMRIDRNDAYGTHALPRLSLLYRFSGNMNARVGYGTGYKIPTSFTAEAEERAYQNVTPVGPGLKAEHSHGFNLDLSSKFYRGAFLLSMNQAFYYTRISGALVPQPDMLGTGMLAYENAASPLESMGFDSNVELSLDELALFLDYSYTDVRWIHDQMHPHIELTPRHRLNLTLTYEAEKRWRTGIEAFYTGKQYLSAASQSRDYWTIGCMLEKDFRIFSLIGNVENLFDVRQTRFEQVVLQPYDNPTFRPIYAPLDGVVANVALELRLR